MPTIEFGFDRAKQQGMRQGVRKGKQLGIEQGIEKKNHEAVARMLTRGMSEEHILDLLQLTAEQLDNIKQRIKN